MKRVVPWFAMLLLCAAGARSQPSDQIATAQAAAALTNAQASEHQSVSFEATVTYYRPYERNLFVQQRNVAIYVHPSLMYLLVPGDRVRVHGIIRESFRPYVGNADITLLGHGLLPKPARPTFEQMIRAETDGRLVTVRAIIESADLAPNSQAPISTTQLSVLLDGGHADVTIDSDDPSQLNELLDAEVELTGVQSGVFDNKMQLTGILFHLQSPGQLKILKRAAVEPWSIPVTPMNRVLGGYLIRDESGRERVHGTITYYQPGVALVLQEGSRSLWIKTDSWSPLHVGYVADAIGFPTVENGFLALTRGEVHETSTPAPVSPALFTWRQLALGGNSGNSHVFDLVSVEGQVVTEVRQATQDEYVLNSDGHLLSAIIRHPGTASTAPLNPMLEIPLGTRIRVTGICMLADANPFNGEVPFNILMRNVDDIAIVARPPWLNVRHLMLIVGLLLLVVIAIGIRSWALERRIRQKTAALAYLEQRRSRILEDINNSRPLGEIVECITEVVSFRLHGAACWCEICRWRDSGKASAHHHFTEDRPAGDSRPLRSRPWNHLRRHEPAHQARRGRGFGSVSGGRLGHPGHRNLAPLFRSCAPLGVRSAHRHSQPLLTGEALETRRFLKPAAPLGIFGFIFIDLNQFKQVNDQYGHQVGDMYLQEAALRMKASAAARRHSGAPGRRRVRCGRGRCAQSLRR